MPWTALTLPLKVAVFFESWTRRCQFDIDRLVGIFERPAKDPAGPWPVAGAPAAAAPEWARGLVTAAALPLPARRSSLGAAGDCAKEIEARHVATKANASEQVISIVLSLVQASASLRSFSRERCLLRRLSRRALRRLHTRRSGDGLGVAIGRGLDQVNGDLAAKQQNILRRPKVSALARTVPLVMSKATGRCERSVCVFISSVAC